MEHLTHSFFSSIVAGKALLYFCRGSGKMGCYSLLIPRHEMNFCKCFNDPRTRAARISQDKLVPGGDSDKARFKIKGQKLCVPHSGGRPGDATVTMGTGELVLTTGASFFFASSSESSSRRRIRIRSRQVRPGRLLRGCWWGKRSSAAAALAPTKVTFAARL